MKDSRRENDEEKFLLERTKTLKSRQHSSCETRVHSKNVDLNEKQLKTVKQMLFVSMASEIGLKRKKGRHENKHVCFEASSGVGKK